MVLCHLVHETGLAVPGVVFRRFRQRRDIGEVGVFGSQAPEQLVVVEFGTVACAVDQRDAALIAALQQLQDHRLGTGQPGTAGQEDQVLRSRLAHEETPVGSRELQLVADLQLLVDVAGGLAARHAAHVELDHASLARRVGQREGTRLLDAGQAQVDVLACLELELAVQFDEHAPGGGREVDEVHHGAAVVLHRLHHGIRLLLDIGFDDHVGQRPRTASERHALLALEVHQREGRGLAVLHLALHHLHLAGSAQAVAAGVRQIEPVAQRRVEQRLLVADLQAFAQRFDRQLIAHGVLPDPLRWPRRRCRRGPAHGNAAATCGRCPGPPAPDRVPA